jgi:hypothetical protein
LPVGAAAMRRENLRVCNKNGGEYEDSDCVKAG